MLWLVGGFVTVAWKNNEQKMFILVFLLKLHPKVFSVKNLTEEKYDLNKLNGISKLIGVKKLNPSFLWSLEKKGKIIYVCHVSIFLKKIQKNADFFIDNWQPTILKNLEIAWQNHQPTKKKTSNKML